ncbi:MAG: Zn-dependent protease [Methanomassiliicoccaceae archaeon]|nr:Zn-dependent protease [Methanomassiliicoccaceae archaeon]
MRTINPEVKAKYSAVEVRDIVISVIVLSVAFTIMFDRGGSTIDIWTLLAISAAVVCASFVTHELAHKFVAQKYRAWAEYRMNTLGLGMALFVSLFGFIFAAPGAVYIKGNIDQRKNGIISAAGPIVNILLGSAAFVLFMATTGLVSSIFFILASVNAFFAVFNMVPIMPLDGYKICRWSLSVYAVMMSAAVLLLLAVWFL